MTIDRVSGLSHNLEVLCANCHHRHHWADSSKLVKEMELIEEIRKIMPSVSEKQHKLMELVAHDPEKAKQLGIPMKVGKEFEKEDKSKYKKPKTKDKK